MPQKSYKLLLRASNRCDSATESGMACCSQGYIYVESYKEAHVREAIQGLRNIFGGKGAKLVPLTEMVDAVNVPRPSKALLGAFLSL